MEKRYIKGIIFFILLVTIFLISLFLSLFVIELSSPKKNDNTPEIKTVTTTLVPTNPKGNFFVLSDLHADMQYNAEYDASTYCRDPEISKKYDSCLNDEFDYPKKFDIFNKTLGQYSCDSPYSLVHSVLRKMVDVNSEPDFIFILGDFVAHCQDSYANTVTTLQKTTDIISDYFPNTRILPVIGNNDMYPHDQLPLGSSKQLYDILSIWKDWILNTEITNDGVKETFLNTGSYSIDLFDKLTVISFNTIYYDVSWCPYNSTICDTKVDDDDDVIYPVSSRVDDPNDQFVYLHKELEKAKNKNNKVFIIGHIGPVKSRGLDDTWLEMYQEKFLQIIKQYNTEINGLFFSHIHRDSFTLVLQKLISSKTYKPDSSSIFNIFKNFFTYSDNKSKNLDDNEDNNNIHERDYFGHSPSPTSNSPSSYFEEDELTNLNTLFISSAVTPRSNQNPTFKEFIYDTENFELLDENTYYLDLLDYQKTSIENWQNEYSFKDTYKIDSLAPEEMLDAFNKIKDKSKYMKKWKKYWGSQSDFVNYKYSDQDYLCTIGTFINNIVNTCIDFVDS